MLQQLTISAAAAARANRGRHAEARGRVRAGEPRPLAGARGATPLLTADAIGKLHASGLHRLAVSLDGADAATHDGFRRVRGSFARTFEIVRDARAAGLPVQVNTTIARHHVPCRPQSKVAAPPQVPTSRLR